MRKESLQSAPSSLFSSLLCFVIPSLLFIQRPLARLLYNDVFLCSSLLSSFASVPPLTAQITEEEEERGEEEGRRIIRCE